MSGKTLTTPVPASGLPPDFQIYTSEGDIRFLRQGVQPPSQVYVDVGDDLTVGVASSATNEVVTFSYRLLRPDNELVLGQFQVRPQNNRTVSVYSESLAEGFLLSLSCKAAVATTRGVTFARAFLSDPSLGPGQPSYMLMADYVTTAMAPAHPNGRNLAPSEGPGVIKFVPGTFIGPAAHWSFTCPTNARWKIFAGYTNLTTDAVVANRLQTAFLTTAGSQSWFGYAASVQAASVGATYGLSQVAPTAAPIAGVGSIAIPPNAILLGGDVFGLLTFFADAGDTSSFATIGVEEWLDNV